MEIIIIGLVAFAASLLTFFSGFGLGTLLLPAFALFFPIDVSIGLTAIVHLLNNLFKLGLIGKFIHWKTALLFGIPGIIGAYFGARLLMGISISESIGEIMLFGQIFTIELLNLIIGSLLIIFALFDLFPKILVFPSNKKVLLIGGLFSGFFGGLSGHQGALRSAFLIKLNLAKEAFIATGVLIACFIDFSRLAVYFSSSKSLDFSDQLATLIIAILSAFLGAYIGRIYLKKLTIKILQLIIGILLMVLGILMILGII